MSKAFTKETDLFPLNAKNYVTPHGYADLKNELRFLLKEERPKMVETVRWAAGNGDRSENGDYIYGKKRLREIDRRVRYLTKRIENAEIIDPKLQQNLTQIFFGATVTYLQKDGSKKTIKVVGFDEADLNKGKISWLSPVAKSLLKANIGGVVLLKTPSGNETIEVIAIKYEIDKKE